MRKILLLCCFIGTVLLPLPAQELSEARQACKVEGRVVNSVTGEPVPRAAVTLLGSGWKPLGKAGLADGRGRFAFDNLQPGSYILSVQRTGFFPESNGSGSQALATNITLSDGERMSNLELKLVPQGIITGKVLDDTGEPADMADVRLVAADRYRSRSRSARFYSSNTNDLGEFRFAKLPAGRYLLQVICRSDYSPDFYTGRGEGQAEGFLPTYYPSVTDPSAAVPLDLSAGQELTGITISAQKGPLYSIRGIVIRAETDSAGPVPNVHLEPRGSAGPLTTWANGTRYEMKPDGSFTLSGVPPGSYWLVANQYFEKLAAYGRTAVEVSGQDLANVAVTLARPLQVSGTVRIEGQADANLPAGSIMLSSAEPRGGTNYGKLNPDGSFKLEMMRPDTYRVDIAGLPPDAYVKSVKLGSAEGVDSGLDLTRERSEVSIDVILSLNSATVEGVVRSESKVPGQKWLTLAPDPPGKRQGLRLKTNVAARPNGAFVINGVAPGDYRLYAWDEPLDEALLDPDFLKQYASKAVKVSVAERGRVQVEVPVIKLDENSR